jgi:hypothetical protein
MPGANQQRGNGNNNMAIDVRNLMMTAISADSFAACEARQDDLDEHSAVDLDEYSADDADDEDDDAIASAVGAVALDGKITRDTVCLDSGALNNIFNDAKWFDELVTLPQPVRIAAANGTSTTLAKGGNVTLSCNCTCGGLSNLTIYDAVLSKNTPLNLVSTSQLRRRGAVFDGLNDRVVLKENG